MPAGITDAIANLDVNYRFCASFLGNLGDLDTPLAHVCEPLGGWSAFPDSPVARAYDTERNGRAVQFVGQDSPNFDYPGEKEHFKGLIGPEYIERLAKRYGRGTPLFNMFGAGAIPRGTMENRIVTDAECLRHNAYEPIEWGHEGITKLYHMDVSYTAEHGDRTVGGPAAFGNDIQGHARFAQLEPPLIYTPSDRSDLSITDQLAYQCKAELKRLDIPSSHLFFDGTGRSEFTASAMRIIGTDVNPIEFGGTATKRPNFLSRRYEEDIDSKRKKGELLPCDEVFDRMVTELWFALAALVTYGQARGIDRDTIREEAQKRLWRLTRGVPHRMSIEPKDELKERLGRSPDRADMLVVGLEGARRLGFKLGGLEDSIKRRPSGWLNRLQRDFAEAREAQELALTN
jgi:hypothetical protein